MATARSRILSALFETLLLLLTCVWIVSEAIDRLLFHKEVVVAVNVWSFIVVALSIAVDSSRSRALSKAAEKYQSQALRRTHSILPPTFGRRWLSSLAWLVFCWRNSLPCHGWLRRTRLRALGVALIVVGVSLRLGKRTVNSLLDTISGELPGVVRTAAGNVPGVEQVNRVRLRRSGPQLFADLTVGVAQQRWTGTSPRGRRGGRDGGAIGGRASRCGRARRSRDAERRRLEHPGAAVGAAPSPETRIIFACMKKQESAVSNCTWR